MNVVVDDEEAKVMGEHNLKSNKVEVMWRRILVTISLGILSDFMWRQDPFESILNAIVKSMPLQ